jgi:exonuclease VII small subunit
MVEDSVADMDTKYRLYLEKDLIEPTLVEIKVASDPYEEKLQYIQLHEEIQEKKQITSYAVLKDLVERIRSTKHPEIGLLLSMKVSLAGDKTSSGDCIASFLDLQGISALIDLVYYRFSLKSGKIETLDAALLYEVLMCCKLVMNHSVGMKAFLDFPGCMDAVARCLFFEFKPLALLVLEILSVSCFSFASTHIVVNSLKNLARTRKEPKPFLSLITALEEEDIELTASTLELINAVLYKADDETKLLLRSLKIDKACQKKLAKVNEELSAVETTEVKDKTSVVRHRADIVLNVSRIASVLPQQMDHGLVALKGIREQSIRHGQKQLLAVRGELEKPPEKGKVEQQNEVHSKLLVVPIERTYFFQKDVLKESVLHTLTHRMIRRHGGGDDDNRDRVMFINDIESAREDSDDPVVNKLRDKLRNQNKSVFLLEINSKYALTSASPSSNSPLPSPVPPGSAGKSLASTSLPPVIVHKMILIFETKKGRDEWSSLIQRYRDQQLLYKGSYFVQSSFLDLSYAIQCSQRFKNSFENFSSFFVEERKQSIEACGIDINDLGSIFDYLVDEMTAEGKEDKLLLLLQELLLISSNDDDNWNNILKKVQKVVRFDGNDAFLSSDEEDGDSNKGEANLRKTQNKGILKLLRQKSLRNEETTEQVDDEAMMNKDINSNSFSKIAKAVILQKQEIKELKRKLQEASSSSTCSSSGLLSRTFSSIESPLNNRSFMMLHHADHHNEHDNSFGILLSFDLSCLFY